MTAWSKGWRAVTRSLSSPRWWTHTLLGITLIALLFARSADADQVTLNLKNADINALIASISEITGKNFIIDPRVKARVTVISAKPMDEKEIYEVFLAILAVHGFAAIPGDKVIKIVPEVNAKQDDIPTVDRGTDKLDEQVVTQVIQVQNVSAAQIVPILRPLIPPQGHLAAYAPTNVLIVSDRAGNVERIANIIDRVDLASTEDVEIVPLKHASANEVVRILTALEQGRTRGEPPATSPPRLVADERTNSVLMSGDTAVRLRLRTLIAHLDTPVEGGGNTEVIYLRYAKAADLVPILQGVSEKLRGEGEAVQPQAPTQGRSDINIQADEATNSLVVTAPPDAIRSLKSVIAQLDIRRAQVLIEAAIADITSDKAAELGIQWVVDGSETGNAVGLTNFTLGTLGTSLGGVLQAIEAGRIPSPLPTGLSAVVGDFESRVRFAALISALGSDSDSNVLSTPTLVTLDNEEAEIIVAQNVPFVTGSFITTGADDIENPFQTIERQDVGLVLKVKPQINEGNAVKLEISQEVSSVIAVDPLQGPTTRKRSIKTNVLVEDGQILVLGGLIEDSLNDNLQKVPGLGDLPVVGNLFRFRSTSTQKTNLMVFLHPVILRDALDGTLRTNDKYSYIRQQQFIARQKGIALLPEEETPLLPSSEQVQQRKSILNTNQQQLPVAPPKAAPAKRFQGFNNR